MDDPGVSFLVNGRRHETNADPETPLLYVLRNDLKLKGARFGCGEGDCGACMVLVDGVPTTSCNLPLNAIGGREVRTLESLAEGGALHPVQAAIADLQAAQCGYCLTGLVITAVSLLADNPAPTRLQIQAALNEVLCRCGAQDRMIRAVEQAARMTSRQG